jgi:hypothetical protein
LRVAMVTSLSAFADRSACTTQKHSIELRCGMRAAIQFSTDKHHSDHEQNIK